MGIGVRAPLEQGRQSSKECYQPHAIQQMGGKAAEGCEAITEGEEKGKVRC